MLWINTALPKSKKPCRLLLIALLAGSFAGCKPQSTTEPAGSASSASSEPASSGAFFQTPFQNEAQYVVETVVSDLAEQMFYARYHRLPDPKDFRVAAVEKPGSPKDAPVYEVQIRLDPKMPELKRELSVTGPIWSAAVYQALAGDLAKAVGLGAGRPENPEDTALLAKLTDLDPETLEQENAALSAALEKDFSNPVLHEKAAVLLGAFLLRDHSGVFFEIRSPLSRLTAHLAMARFLGGNGAGGINGRMAEAMLLTLINNQTPALERLHAIGTNDTAVAALVRALRTRITGDYRLLAGVTHRTPLESAECFLAKASYVGTTMAWSELNDVQQRTIDFVRMANQIGYSVETGHQLLRTALQLEMEEIGAVYDLSRHETLPSDGLVKALNALPERCFIEAGGQTSVRVIGWGQWAAFLQRHLCHAVRENFRFLEHHWGVHDEARKFSANCDRGLGGLRLYPFVRRFNCTDEAAYHRAENEGYQVTVATPHLVPAECWNYLWYTVGFAPAYMPSTNIHISDWHNHNPLPGTAYDLYSRLYQASLCKRPDYVARLEQLHELAPYDCRIANVLVRSNYNGRPTYEQAKALYGAVLPYSVHAMWMVANTVKDKPEQYEKIMLPAAELSPAYYYDLGDYALERRDEDQAAKYIDKACDADPDSVRVSNHSEWRVRYYLKKGDTKKAGEIADFGAEVYSARGLLAKAYFLEATTNYTEAFAWYARNEERYDDPGPLLDFCTRYKALTGNERFEPEVKKRLGDLFPKGIEKVTLKDFQGPPADGVSINEQNNLVRAAGLKVGDVIVAVYGIRVHNFRQYTYGRNLKNTPELELIVWQGDAYREFKPSPPNHRFGVDFGDYPKR